MDDDYTMYLEELERYFAVEREKRAVRVLELKLRKKR
jgi:hypothetical protein